MSLMRDKRCRPESWMSPKKSACCSLSSPNMRSAKTSLKPMMALSGVRSSWGMLAAPLTRPASRIGAWFRGRTRPPAGAGHRSHLGPAAIPIRAVGPSRRRQPFRLPMPAPPRGLAARQRQDSTPREIDLVTKVIGGLVSLPPSQPPHNRYVLRTCLGAPPTRRVPRRSHQPSTGPTIPPRSPSAPCQQAEP